ncbi:hypothetical protein ACS127_10205 [Amphibacillus sp. Q70]|uniref:hypothetical protein n=1 Tax=Amphibacillus sp. Q70 TaxID=3453416 RepID=UPI003F82E5FD
MRGYNKLSKPLQQLFNKVHGRHLNAMGQEMRKEYSRDKITQLKVDPEERCIQVYFVNGEMFKYFNDLTWG